MVLTDCVKQLEDIEQNDKCLKQSLRLKASQCHSALTTIESKVL